MKKIYKTLILIFILIIQINVHAEENVPITSLPKSYSYGGYEFTIEGLVLKIYEMDNNDDDEGFNNYATNKPDKTIPFNSSNLTINPTMETSDLNEASITLVDLNFNITKEQIEELLENEGITPTIEKSYLSEIVVKYKLTKSKIESAHMYNLNFLKTFFSWANGNDWRNEVYLNSTIEQPINIVVSSFNEDTNEKEIFYDTKVTNDNNLATSLLNYLALSVDGLTTMSDKVNELFMFHSIENVQTLLDMVRTEEPGNNGDDDDDSNDEENINDKIEDIKDNIINHPSTSTNPSTSNNQTVKVENTASFKSRYLYIISILMITIGTSLIGHILIKEQNKKM